LLIGTNKGIYKVGINAKNYLMMTQNYFFGDIDKNIIKSMAYLDNQQVLFAFEGDENFNIFDYS